MAEDDRRNLPHFYLPQHGEREQYTYPPRGGGGSLEDVDRDRQSHSERIELELLAALAVSTEKMEKRDPDIASDESGHYIEFKFPDSHKAVVEALEDKRTADHIEIMAVRPSYENQEESTVCATVFVPESRKDVHLKKVQKYREENDGYGKPKNRRLVTSIEKVKSADARSVFTDPIEFFPEDGKKIWWEVWLRKDRKLYFDVGCEKFKVDVGKQIIEFVERDVVLAQANVSEIDEIMDHTYAIAELRLARNSPSGYESAQRERSGEYKESLKNYKANPDRYKIGLLKQDETKSLSDDFVARITSPGNNAPAVCVLDSGSTQIHPLLQLSLDASDLHSCFSRWTGDDTAQVHSGHGTEMSGLALYGDLSSLLSSSSRLSLGHKLESVKILPDVAENDPSLYGDIIAQAVDIVERKVPDRMRVFSLSITEGNDDYACDGEPSSWSSEIDHICYKDSTSSRLFFISCGNTYPPYKASEYPSRNDLSEVQSPAQSWNALAVGAMTEMHTVHDPDYSGYIPMAPNGDLCPYSRTSVPWSKEWPMKPDIVFEGGNCAINPSDGFAGSLEDLQLVTTNNLLNQGHFAYTGATSAATALASRMGAQILSNRQGLWPETVRALMVHSAEWTDAMKKHLATYGRELVLQRYGYGVPNLSIACNSMKNDISLVIEKEIQPFRKDGNDIKTCDMVVHDLPWPSDALRNINSAKVQMRVTLSYFIEPSPGARGWGKRHSYQSHGFRFEVRRAGESMSAFRKRVNREARNAGEKVTSIPSTPNEWRIGSRLRGRGSIQSDTWEGHATDLAGRNGIAVYPVGGWWREKRRLKRYDVKTRYALVVTIRCDEDVDLYAEVKAKVPISV